MSDIEIREVDRTDEAELHAWWSAGHAAMSQRPVDLWPDWEISRRSLPQVDPDNRVDLLGAFAGDAMVGSALAVLPLEDNTHLGMLEVYVPPEHRRRGVGSALLDRAEEIAVTGGRTTLLADVRVPVDEDSADSRWAVARGYAVANIDTVKVVDVAPTAELLPGLEALAAERRGDYRLAWWTDPAPEEHLASLAAAMSRFLGEIPLGDLDVKPQAWTPERLRAREARRAAQQRDSSPWSRSLRPARWPATRTSPSRRTRPGSPTSATRWCCRTIAATASAWPSRCCSTSRSGRCTPASS